MLSFSKSSYLDKPKLSHVVSLKLDQGLTLFPFKGRLVRKTVGHLFSVLNLTEGNNPNQTEEDYSSWE